MPEALDGNELAKIKEVMNNLEQFHAPDDNPDSQSTEAADNNPQLAPSDDAAPPPPAASAESAPTSAASPPPRPESAPSSASAPSQQPAPSPPARPTSEQPSTAPQSPAMSNAPEAPVPEQDLAAAPIVNPEPDTIVAPVPPSPQPPADSGGPFAAPGGSDKQQSESPVASESPFPSVQQSESPADSKSPFPANPLGVSAGAADFQPESPATALGASAGAADPSAVLGADRAGGDLAADALSGDQVSAPAPSDSVASDPLAGITPLSNNPASPQAAAAPAASAEQGNNPFAPPAKPDVAVDEPAPFSDPGSSSNETPVGNPSDAPFADPSPGPVANNNPEPGPMGQSENQAASAAFDAARSANVAEPPAPADRPLSTASDAPEDILYAIADSGPSVINSAADTVMTARQEAQELAPEKTLRKKAAGRVKFEALDFDAIVPNHPLVIASYSPSGGVGKSSTAMNLGILIATIAENMAQQQGEGARVPRVLTLDGDIVMGSLSLRLTSKVEPNLYDLQKYIDQRTAAGFQGEAAWPSSFDSAAPGEEPMYKFTHWPDSPSNFSVLAAPSDPSHFWHFGPDHYRNILRMLGRFYDVIIIDCGTDLVLDSQRAWLSHANEVFLITSPDSDRLYNCAKAARIIASSGPHPQDRRPKEEQKNYPPLATREKLSLVVTRYNSDSGLKLDLLVDKLFPWLDEDQKFWIPDVSQDMTRANNTGRFLVKENQEYAEVINRMAKHAFHRYVSSRSMQPMA